MARRQRRDRDKREEVEEQDEPRQMPEYDFQGDLAIDEDSLDQEWVNQPQLMMKYSALSVVAQDNVRKLEERLKIIRSELILEANDPDSGVLDKINQQTVEAYYRDHKRHKRAKQMLFDAMLEAEMLQNAVFAFQARKLALENLVRLHGQNYFGTPNTGVLDEEAFERIEKLIRKTVTQEMRNRLNKDD